MFAAIYVPRGLFYLIYLAMGRKIKKLLWLMNVKSVGFFLLCAAGLGTLIFIIYFSAKLKDTFGTGLMYMVILFMTPVMILLLLDLYLCMVT